jgi:HEPN domain-containing protein
MQRDRKVVAASWLAAAERDLRGGHAMLAVEPSLAAFHAQQAAEKALKAMLVLVLDDHPRTHAATTLVRELIAYDPSMAALEADASALDLYYLTSRYPDAVGDVDPGNVIALDDAERALARAERIVAQARSRV